MSEERKKKKIVKLELGDIIRIDATDNEEYNGQSFYINYIDNTKIKLLNIRNLKPEILNVVDEIVLDKVIGNTYVFDVKIEHEITTIFEGERHSLLWFGICWEQSQFSGNG